MISAWDVYWVMQLDSIGSALFGIAFLCCFVGGGLTVFRTVLKGFAAGGDKEAEAIAKAVWVGPWVLAVGLFAWTVNTLLPSSKTAAAMIVLPALTSDAVTEPLTREAGEIYRLAKKALEQAVDAEPKPRADEPEAE